MPRTLSVGMPSTLASYLQLSQIFFGEDSEAYKYIQGLIAEQGPDEEVVADEAQMVNLLMELNSKGSD